MASLQFFVGCSATAEASPGERLERPPAPVPHRRKSPSGRYARHRSAKIGTQTSKWSSSNAVCVWWSESMTDQPGQQCQFDRQMVRRFAERLVGGYIRPTQHFLYFVRRCLEQPARSADVSAFIWRHGFAATDAVEQLRERRRKLTRKCGGRRLSSSADRIRRAPATQAASSARDANSVAPIRPR